MRNTISRRRFVTSATAASLSTLAIGAAPLKPAGAKKPIIVASANGLQAITKAMELVKKGHDEHSRPQAATTGRQDDVQCVVLRRQ